MRITYPKKVQHGDFRRRSAFLWMPLHIAGETRWLERAEWMEYYICFRSGFWKPTEWID